MDRERTRTRVRRWTEEGISGHYTATWQGPGTPVRIYWNSTLRGSGLVLLAVF